MIEIQALFKKAGGRTILSDVTTAIPRGETVAIVGPSGAGKSTLLRCLNGLERFDAGQVQIAGQHLASGSSRDRGAALQAIRRQVGMVFQSFNLFPHLTVLENLCLAPLKVLGKPRAAAQQTARQLLGEVNLSGFENRYPRQLSGGEQQRVAIARALAMEPQVILFDEPTSSLDPELVFEVVEVIERLARQNYTLLIVTHQMGVAKRVAGRVLFLESGRILEDSPAVKFFSSPQTERAREFLEKVSF
ncbi:MAG TPA: amino acid ABC transporter ATP-binding protein [Acidobacteriota bacterium]|jgi:polar amino acid transport system ATP-binding protein